MYIYAKFCLMRLRILLLFLCTAALLSVCAFAEESDGAECINSVCTFRVNGETAPTGMLDDNVNTYTKLSANSTVTISAPEMVACVYIKFDQVPGSWTIATDTGTIMCGENGFIHEYAAIGASEMTFTFSEAVIVTDIYLFPEGELPDWVQIWNPPWDQADLLLLPTHSDDDQLFFAGLIPTAIDAGARVQVAYFVYHWDERLRPHELLDGLWTCGLRNYPVMGQLHDSYSESEEEAAAILANEGWSYEDIVGIQTELLRRFQPQIVVTHDINGEYGHGAHILNCATMLDAICLAADPQQYPDSAAQYGVWDVPKTYVHLYTENPIVLDLDKPLDSFGGKTAFQLAQDAFLCHPTQLIWDGFRNWLYGQDLASEITIWSPCQYGLWRSLVGSDTSGDTMFENIVFYDEQLRLAAEAEQARIAASENAALSVRDEFLEQAAEAARIAEEEAKQAAEAASQAETPVQTTEITSEAAEQELTPELRMRRAFLIGLGAVIAICIFIWILVKAMRKKAAV